MSSIKLQLSLKKEWFAITSPEGKREDYRELTPYWFARLCLYEGRNRSQDFWYNNICHLCLNSFFDKVTFKKFDFNIMTLGYPPKSDTSKFKKFVHEGIEIRHGRPEWGALPGEVYFVILHGRLTA